MTGDIIVAIGLFILGLIISLISLVILSMVIAIVYVMTEVMIKFIKHKVSKDKERRYHGD